MQKTILFKVSWVDRKISISLNYKKRKVNYCIKMRKICVVKTKIEQNSLWNLVQSVEKMENHLQILEKQGKLSASDCTKQAQEAKTKLFNKETE